jgi:anti-sigma factor RsiW
MHGEIEELLPWYAAGTLSRHDASRVEAALAQNPELARRFVPVCEELAETVYLNQTLGTSSPRAMEQLFSKIDAEPARKPARSPGLAAALGGLFAVFGPHARAFAASAAVLAILLQAGVITGMLLKDSKTTYEIQEAPAASPAFIMIRFAPGAAQDDVTAFLKANKLQVAGGPFGDGIYRVRVPGSDLSKADIVKKLRDDKIVAFAE